MKPAAAFLIFFLFCYAGLEAQDTCSLKPDLGPDIVLCMGDSVTIMPVGKYSEYLWSNDSTGSSHTTCKADTLWLQVKDTNGCTGNDTIVITMKDTTISGTVRNVDGVPLAKTLVTSIYINQEDSVPVSVDSTYTDSLGKYCLTPGRANIFIKIRPDRSTYPESLPCYYQGGALIQTANPIELNACDTFIANAIVSDAQIKVSPEFLGALGGWVKRNGAVLQKLDVLLLQNDTIRGYASTDETGYFVFDNIAHGKYRLWADFPYIDNSSFPVISINNSNPSKDSLTFVLNHASFQCQNYAYTTIEDALSTPAQVYSLNSNSLRYNERLKSFVEQGEKIALRGDIARLVNLEELTLLFNQVTELPAELGSLSKLEILDLSGNKISSLPGELAQLANLKYLNLKNNKLTRFPPVILKLPSLTSLYLQVNDISSLPAGIGDLTNLKVLSIESNFNLTELPLEIGKLENLEHLNLGSCSSLKKVPVELKNLKKLRYLNLSYTRVSKKTVQELQEALPGCKIKFEQK